MLDKISSYIMLSWGLTRYLIAFAAGAVANFALAPFDFFAVLFISFPILVWLLDGAGGHPDHGFIKQRLPAFLTGWYFGFGYFTGGLWWLGNAVLVSDEGSILLLPFAVLGLPAVLAIFFGLATACARIYWKDNLGRIFLLSASFGLFEFLRGTVFTGFPWNVIGYGAMPVPVAMQSVELVGIYGMTVLTVFVTSVPALTTTIKGLKTGLAIAALLLVAHIGYGVISLQQTQVEFSDQIVRIVQPSIDQSEKWDDEKREEIFQTYLDLTSSKTSSGLELPTLILWPETALPYILTQSPAALSDIADNLIVGQTLLTGAVKLETGGGGQPDKYYNTIYMINDQGQIEDSADKLHLVPFGEYLPFEIVLRAIGLSPLAETFGGFSSASSQKALKITSSFSVLPLICYEAIFPKYSSVDNLPNNANVNAIVNVTNDAWYGHTPGPYQHLRQAQIRAIESGLPLIRAGNNGISVITDTRGRIISGISLGHIGIVDQAIPHQRTPILSHQDRNLAFFVMISLFFVFSFFLLRK